MPVSGSKNRPATHMKGCKVSLRERRCTFLERAGPAFTDGKSGEEMGRKETDSSASLPSKASGGGGVAAA